MANDLFAMLAVLLIVALGAAVFQPAFASGAERVTTTESVTVDYQTSTSVNESGLRYSDDVSVAVNGSSLTQGSDFRWNETSGEISFVNTSATSSGDTATVTVEYRAPSNQQRSVAQMLNVLATPLVLLLFLLAGGYIFREVI